MSKKNPKLPPRVWYGPDKLKAAFLAGQGRGAYEIAQIIGGTTPARVRSMLNSHDIPLLRGVGTDALMIYWKETDRLLLDKIATSLDRSSPELGGLIIRRVISERPDLIAELIQDLDVL